MILSPNTLVLFGIATFVTVSFTREYMCTDKQNLKNVRVGERLREATFLSQIRNGSKGFMICAKDCLLRKRCKSFNFETKTGMCELNRKSSEGGQLTSDENFVYSDIAHVNKALAGVCESHLCTEDQMCQSINSEPRCFQCSTASECGVCSDIREISNKKFLSFGCFYSKDADKERPLNDVLGDFDGYDKITEKEKAINACAEAALSKGYELFGLEEFFKCYGGNYADAVLQNPVGVDRCTASCFSGIGLGEHAMLVYHWL